MVDRALQFLPRTRSFGATALLLWALAGACLCASPTASEKTSLQEVTVRVYNYAQLSDAVLGRAETAAKRIFREAGIETEWIRCGPGTRSEPPSAACDNEVRSVTLVITSQAPPAYPVEPTSAGLALLSGDDRPGRFAYIFHCRIKEFAQDTSCSPRTLLAYVMAHEIGHLLLPRRGHSAVGIMQANWADKEFHAMERGQLRFTANEARRMQTATGVVAVKWWRSRIDDTTKNTVRESLTVTPP